MFPGVNGFEWTAGHLIFLGAFFTIVLILLSTAAIALSRSARDLRAMRVEAIRWHSDFHELGARERHCRHEFTGTFKQRVCDNGFDCRECPMHAKLVASGAAPAADHNQDVFGLNMPLDRFYHRGHAWAKPEPDGTVTVGLDDLATRAFGAPDKVVLPAAGARLDVNGTAWHMFRGASDVRVLSPVEGEVIETGDPACGWYLKVRPSSGGFDARHLLTGCEVRPWIMRELERLQMALSPATVGPSLADGGIPVEDMPRSFPAADWDNVWGRMFLNP
jgi:glycine cleavage system H lipoate-binding protein